MVCRNLVYLSEKRSVFAPKKDLGSQKKGRVFQLSSYIGAIYCTQQFLSFFPAVYLQEMLNLKRGKFELYLYGRTRFLLAMLLSQFDMMKT